ncbi:GTP-binding proten HflX [Methanocaldococcus vulcanius M7]|uniref:GTPase HflX n=1 Tax=Methanocaldococcus vulcanius (strain ATCC 700851 / DSM 12094 / M7) TaxID=579137 RepID=C9RGL7_METVM|nr:GTP-binding proten HflX [Methanocaldococcus vulcanius M7]
MKKRALLILRKDKKYDNKSIDELKELAEVLYRPIKSVVQIRKPDPKYQIGSGLVEKLVEIIKEENIEIVIVGNTLTPSQKYNLAKKFKVEVIDKVELVLRIFYKHARTKEAKLQVRLAELQYELPRAREKVRLAKMGEQPGFGGYGDYEVEKYYQKIKKEIATIKRKLEKVKEHRKIARKSREKFDSVGLIGYTNAGKTSLLNILTGEDKESKNQVFTTLTTTTRAIKGIKRKILITDTVGFMDDLPPFMIEAFLSTIEESANSDLILIVVDSSDSIEEIERKLKVNHEILSKINCKSPIITVLNKVDKISEKKKNEIIDKLERYLVNPIFVSARYGENIDLLISKILENLNLSTGTVETCDPKVISYLYENTEIIEDVMEGSTHIITFRAKEKDVNRILKTLRKVKL